jgi:hypothetical protein
MQILQLKDFKQFEIEKVQGFMTYELENLAFNFDANNFDSKEKSLSSNS